MKYGLKYWICGFIWFLVHPSCLSSQSVNSYAAINSVRNVHSLNAGSLQNRKIIGKIENSEYWGFQENIGQVASADGRPADFVLFKAEAPNLNIWITTTGITYQFFKLEEEEEEEEREQKKGDNEKSGGEKDAKTKWYRVDMVLKESTIKKENILKEGNSVRGEANYYLGHCPKGVFNAKSYSKIIIKEVYKGIDWAIYMSKDGGIKHDFIVHSQADPNQIKLIYEGRGKFNVKDNQISFENKLGKIKEGNLLCYQNSTKNVIPAHYVVSKNISPKYLGSGNLPDKKKSSWFKKNERGVFSFEVSVQLNEYNKNETLVIDPQLNWATFVGSNNADGAYDIKLDAAGNIYVAGYTSSTTFPLQSLGGAYNQVTSTGWEGFIMRFNAAMALTWSTYYGGNGTEEFRSLVIDPTGNIYVTGTTASTNFPLQNLIGGYNQTTLNGGASTTFNDAIILRFTNAGICTWATYYGGNTADWGNSIALDALGNIFITGHTQSSIFPTQSWVGAYNQAVYGGGTGDVFILRFTNAGIRTWATYYGGSGITSQEQGNSITCDVSGNIYVVGLASSANFPLQNLTGAYNQATLASSAGDAFILRFTSAGVRTWATFYGGSAGVSGAHCIRIDPTGNIFVIGSTAASNFPTQTAVGAYNQTTIGGASDAFILRFTNTGVRTWATFYGGNGAESIGVNGIGGNNIAFDNCGNLYASFRTASTNNPTLGNTNCGFYDATISGSFDLFLVKFNPIGTALWATYFGGSGIDLREPLTIDSFGNLIFAGEWISSTASPLANPGGAAYYDATANGSDDFFISKFIPTPPTYSQTQVNPPGCFCNGVATISVTCGESPYSYQWSNATSVANTTLATHSISNLCPGVYQVTVTSNCSYTYTTTYTIVNAVSTPTANFTVVNATCTVPTGSVTINSITNGVPNYTISEGTSTLAANINVPYTISNVSVGTHTYVITGSNGCSATFTTTILPGGAAPDLNITLASSATLTCSNSTILAAGTSTTSNITYSWIPQNITTNTTLITNAGSYTFVVTNTLNGCSSLSIVTISQNTVAPNVSITTPNTLTCINSSVIITGSSTVSGVSYSWQSQNILTNTIVAATPGNYTLIVTDPINSCTNGAVAVVSQDTTSPNIAITSSGSLSCINLTITLTGNSTISGLTYTWLPQNINTNTTTASTPGTYSVSVTNTVNGCVNNTIITVPQNTIVPDLSANVTGSLTCSNATVNLIANSSTGSAIFNWQPQNVNTNSATATTNGNFTCTVTDTLNGCFTTTIVSVVNSSVFPNVSIVQPATLTCLNTSLILIGTSTTTGVTFSWQPQNVNTATTVVTNSGTYTFTAINLLNGCSTSSVVTVVRDISLPNFTAAASNSINCMLPTSTLTGIGSGIAFIWNGGMLNNATNPALVNLGTNYTVTATNISNGCTSNSIVSIAQSNLPPNFTAVASNSINCLLPTSTLTANGTGLTFVWNGGVLSNASNPVVVNSGGNYTVTATNPSDGCTFSIPITIAKNTTAPDVTASASGTLNCITTSVVLNGSSITSGVTFSWSPNTVNTTTLPIVSTNSAGIYTLTVTNPFNGCINFVTVAVPIFTSAISVLDQIKCYGTEQGALVINSTGGTPLFNIANLNNGNTLNNISSFPVNLNGLGVANYSIQITDANNCTQMLFITLDQPPFLSITLNGKDTICEGQTSVIQSSVTGGSAPYVFTWMPTGGMGSILTTTPMVSTTFTASVIDSNGCKAEGFFHVQINHKPNASLVNNQRSGCAPICESFVLSQPQVPGYLYHWSFNNESITAVTLSPLYNPNICFSIPGTYNANLTVRTPEGCELVTDFYNLIKVYPKPIADFYFSPEVVSFLEPKVNFINLSTDAKNYVWYNVNSIFSREINPGYVFKNPDPGLFLFTLIAINNSCSDTISKIITVEDDFLFYIPNSFTPNDDNLNDFFRPVMSGYKERDYSFIVFDRWGAQIFNTSDPGSKGWDGFYKGEICQDGVYVWKANVITNRGKSKEYTGHVTLIK